LPSGFFQWKYLQANAIPFQNKDQLPGMMSAEIARRQWNPAWRNGLEIVRDPSQFADEVHNHSGRQRPVRYWHIAARNNHKHKPALNCCAFFEKVVKVSDGEEVPIKIKHVEYKWRGVPFPHVVIPAQEERELDTFRIYEDEPQRAVPGNFSDSPRHAHDLTPGEYCLHFAVHSTNFPVARKTLLFSFNGRDVRSDVLSVAAPSSAIKQS
jgi:hypothetical protein